jgi:Chromo (CHRromatin Organisation MOdifier) domain
MLITDTALTQGLSYLHNSWERVCDLEKFDGAIHSKLKRYAAQMEVHYGTANWQKAMAEEDEALGDDKQYYEADLVEVQRIIACTAHSTEHEAQLRAARHREYLASGDDTTGTATDADADKATTTDTTTADAATAVDSSAAKDTDAATASDDAAAASGDTIATSGDATGSDADAAAGISVGSVHPEDGVMYLVKWRGLSYDLVSWEKFGDLKHVSDQVLHSVSQLLYQFWFGFVCTVLFTGLYFIAVGTVWYYD